MKARNVLLMRVCVGIKIVQQIAILMGCAVLPHLKNLVEIIFPGLNVRTTCAVTLSCLLSFLPPLCPFLLRSTSFCLVLTWSQSSCVHAG